ncbi:mannose-1-phosphate guanylyltransferase/mannose-6-phosphate isomerase [Sphingomonas sp. SUN039]|uniref:mannose-1-phosphate guanylyltransferase/mannose-6-phosphate isomerase n=1 Tax=Sphingomonas sp. SUN039 TaxID=2937787 RepID=UPI002164BF33|nr:mannose-1-phosphate guanylyltransferase/mannose-6-phosphate isomerase [Sphingomonas sp. SUN039]UVO55463.1 mannose-1-phosphate guanylyltransferase/mannose-6-phosphate isomerase [Sphingomonas sp. SUN039]
MTAQVRITPVILSGGSGTRLWPMSRPDRPKQFLPLASDATMFEATVARCADRSRFAAPMVVANARHADLIEAQLGGAEATLVLEPLARNTAPAIALAALLADPASPLLVMPSDHVIADEAAFMAAVDAALPLVADGWLTTFGIAPDGPETGYGYIQTGEVLSAGVHKVARFVEKPDRARAEAMIAGGDHVWNGGIFLFRADAFLGALAVYEPDMLAAAQRAVATAKREGSRILPDEAAFAASPSESIDYAVMEKAAKENGGRVAVVPVAMGWSDVGSWDALHTLGSDADGNAHHGEVIALDTSNCLIRSDGIRIAAVGVHDLIVVASGNDVLILPRGQSQDVKRIVEAMKAKQDA